MCHMSLILSAGKGRQHLTGVCVYVCHVRLKYVQYNTITSCTLYGAKKNTISVTKLKLNQLNEVRYEIINMVTSSLINLLFTNMI